MKRLALVIVPCALLLAVLMAVSAQSQDDNSGGGGEKKVVFSVGDPQGIDSMNPLIGVTVAAYEAWNIQYATLTDKAANDFHTIPGLAESWKGSKDGLKWSDGKPLTAEDVAWNVNTSRDEEWINHSATTVDLDATAKDEFGIPTNPRYPTEWHFSDPEAIDVRGSNPMGPIITGLRPHDQEIYVRVDGVNSNKFRIRFF